jgi:rod shape determining protein RodA
LIDVDWNLILIYFLLVFIGWINIYATGNNNLDNQKILNFSVEHGKQVFFILSGLLIIIFLLFIESRFYMQFGSVFYLIAILSLLGLFLFGKTVNGAKSWYAIDSFTLQPSEFVKIGVALGVAKLIGDKQFKLNTFQSQLKAFVLIIIPMILIALQPDMGSALVFISLFFVFYREGLPKYYIIVGLSFISLALTVIKFGLIQVEVFLSLVFITFMIYMFKNKRYFFRKYWMQYIISFMAIGLFTFFIFFIYSDVLPQHQKDRIDLTLGIIKDNKGKGYNILQSQVAIGNGGLFGKGFLKGEQTKGNFVPEQHTDFIFSAIGEEWGFLGSTFVIILYMALILRIIHLSENAKSKFTRVYGYSIASIFFFHFTINIGMVIGLFPTIGIPLPFLSYGGSSFWAFTILLFIFIRLYANNKYEL